MSNLYRDVKACCPFYQTQKKEKSGAMYIKCEKIISKGCIVLRFPSVQRGDKGSLAEQAAQKAYESAQPR